MPAFSTADIPDMSGKTVIVTGAGSGIGRTAAAALANAGARVVLAVRDQGRGEAAAATMPGATKVRLLDLASVDSVRLFAAAWQGEIDLLINNAGVMVPPLTRTADGFELQFGTNHLGHFALTNLLLPNVTGRVVTVSSSAQQMGAIDFDDLNWERKRYRPWRAYAQSKLANLLFSTELQRRLAQAGSPVKATAAHPGYAATNLQSHAGNQVTAFAMTLGNRRSRAGRRRRRPAHSLRGRRRHPGRQLRRPVRPPRPRSARRAQARPPLRRVPRPGSRPSPLAGLGGAHRRQLP